MPKDFNDFGFKNVELLRHHISNDLKNINYKITKKSNDFLGYIFASLIDVLIVVLYYDEMKKNTVIVNILFIFVLSIIFFIINLLHNKIINYCKTIYIISGKQKYTYNNIYNKIDDFDNIACDSMMIALNYMEKYEVEKDELLKEFYFYEMFHYYKKAYNKFVPIYNDRNLYIRILSTDELYKIDKFRINNFIKFLKKEYKFIENIIISGKYNDELIRLDLQNINADLEKFSKL